MNQCHHFGNRRSGPNHLAPTAQNGRSVSPKRSRAESEGRDQEGEFQPFKPRRPRKVAYGNSKVTMDGAEAAPV